MCMGRVRHLASGDNLEHAPADDKRQALTETKAPG